MNVFLNSFSCKTLTTIDAQISNFSVNALKRKSNIPKIPCALTKVVVEIVNNSSLFEIVNSGINILKSIDCPSESTYQCKRYLKFKFFEKDFNNAVLNKRFRGKRSCSSSAWFEHS